MFFFFLRGKRNWLGQLWEGRGKGVGKASGGGGGQRERGATGAGMAAGGGGPSASLVTGANRGIGLGIVRALAGGGGRVLATCRAPDRAEELLRVAEASGGRVQVRALDVTCEASVATLAYTTRGWLGREGRLGQLWHSAGIAPGGYEEQAASCSSRNLLRSFRTNTVCTSPPPPPPLPWRLDLLSG